MSRYYVTGTGREGSFCTAIQGSDAPEKFGMYENTNVIHYIVNHEDFNYDYLNELCEEFGINKDNDESKNKKILDDIDTENFTEEKRERLCDLYLGLKIYSDIKENSYCELDAEI